MNWLRSNGELLAIAALVFGVVGMFLAAYYLDGRECEETGMHSVCQDWVSINGGMVCMRSKKEPCEP